MNHQLKTRLAYKHFLTLLFLIAVQPAFSQKDFHLTISLDSTIDSRKIFCAYDNGKDTVYLKNHFVNNRCSFTGKFYSNSAFFSMHYTNPQNAYCSNIFAINNKPATIHFTDPEKPGEYRLNYDSIKNAYPIADTSNLSTKFFVFTEKEAMAMVALLKKNQKHPMAEDTFKLLNEKIWKALNDRTILYIQKHPKDYFSFWVFQQRVVKPSIILMKNDTGYIRSLQVSFNSIFPDFYKKSFEGRQIINEIEGLIKSKGPNEVAYPFSLKNIAGKTVSLSDFKGKYILLDFWASWCGPCRENNPVLKAIHDKYKNSNFELISISADVNADNWKKASKEDSVTWVNLSDLKGTDSGVAIEYGIAAYPTYILIDPSGKVIMRNEADIESIRKKIGKIFPDKF